VGEYQIEVSSSGYKTTAEHASVMPSFSQFNVYVYVSKESEAADEGARSKSAIAPRVQSEMDKGVEKMKHQQFDAARSHFEKAAKLAPGNADVPYLLGMLEYYQNHLDLACTQFERTIAMNPAHERALLTLGEIQLRRGLPLQGARTLEKAYLMNGADWRTHYLLAFAYAEQKEFEKAQTHAQRAGELAKERGAPARVLMGRILASQNKIAEARDAFSGVVRDFPNDAAAKEATAALAVLDKPVLVATTAPVAGSLERPSLPPEATSGLPALPTSRAVIRPWAPPDVDAKEYNLAPDVACSMEQVLQRTQGRIVKQMSNFEKFMATEHIEHQDVDANGNSGLVKAKDFTYLVFIRRGQKNSFFLDEERDGGENLSQFPTALASHGLVGLGVFLFTPEYQNDVSYTCAGLGEWRGQAAWEIRFEQRREVESRLMTWKNSRGVFPVPLKGRVWIAANSYDLLHIETDLREAVPQLELERDHLVIDYGPVKFEHGKTALWLPWYAELYLQVHGRRYHHRHTLTNYALFSVDTEHQIKGPKEPRKDD
jgi:tetratricopeptide (TPR) repeat protein